METSDQYETIDLTECANYQLFIFYISFLLLKNITLHSYICDDQKVFFIAMNVVPDDSHQSYFANRFLFLKPK